MYDNRYSPKRNFRVDEDMLCRVIENKKRASQRERFDIKNDGESCRIYMKSAESLAMVCSPIQEFCGRYSEEQGLQRGTIFSQLDKPFRGDKRSVSPRGGYRDGCKE